MTHPDVPTTAAAAAVSLEDEPERRPPDGAPGTGGDRPAAAPARRPTGDRLPRRRRRRVDGRLAVTVALGVAGGLLLEALVSGAVTRLQGLLTTLILALFLSFAMEPAVQWMHLRGIRRGLGTMLVFLGGFLLFAGFVALMVPVVVNQSTMLIDRGPELVEGLADQAQRLPGNVGTAVSDWLERQRETLPDRLPDLAQTVGRGVLGASGTLLGGLVQVLTMLLVTFYLVADAPRLRRALVRRLEPARQSEVLGVWELAIAKTGGYVYSRLLTAIASSVVHAVAFTLLDLPSALGLALWVGLVSSLVPVIGTYIAGLLPLIVALARGPGTALAVLAVIIVYQQVENYLVGPRLTAAAMDVHPAIAFVSVLAGGALLGAVGALLAVPAAAIVVGLVSAYGERHEIVDHDLVSHGPVVRPRDG